jgi:hypothetical protein
MAAMGMPITTAAPRTEMEISDVTRTEVEKHVHNPDQPSPSLARRLHGRRRSPPGRLWWGLLHLIGLRRGGRQLVDHVVSPGLLHVVERIVGQSVRYSAGRERR